MVKKILVKKLLLTVLLFISSGVIYSQEIVTDRPDKTESAITVGKNRLQIETGLEFASFTFGDLYDETGALIFKDVKLQTLTLPTTLIRFGITNNIELRFGFDFEKQNFNVDDLSIDGAGNEKLSLNPPTIGAKFHIHDGKDAVPTIALIGAVTIPEVGAKEKQTKHLNPEFILALSNDLNDNLSLGYNLGLARDDESKTTNFFYSASLGIGLTEKIGAFAEIYGNFPNDDYVSDQNIDGGFTYLINKSLQIDIYGGVGLSSSSNNFMIGSGIAYKFNNF